MDKIHPRNSKLIEKEANIIEIENKPLTRGENILRTICAFLGIDYDPRKDIDSKVPDESRALMEDFMHVAQKVKVLFDHVNYNDPNTFNDSILALRELLHEIGNRHADKLPDAFSSNALMDFIFKEGAKELTSEEVLAIYDKSDAQLAEYDSIAIAAILKGIRDSVLEEAQPKINLSEEELINLNTRVECFGSHFQTTEASSNDMKRIGSGAAHSVYSLPYAVGHFEGEAISERIKAFKPIDERETLVMYGNFFPKILGLDTTPGASIRTRYLERNLVVSDLDNKLGFGVIARTHPAIHEGQRGIVMELYTHGMEGAATDARGLVSARPLKDMDDAILEAILADPHYRRDSVSLQLIDCITGQFDRHNENYLGLLGDKNQYLGLRGIDNDISSGATFDQENADYHNQIAFPQVVDRQQYDTIMALEDSDIDDICKNRLTTAEINANKERLALLKDHLKSLHNKGQIINASSDCKHWKTGKVASLLCKSDPIKEYTSYYGRELAFQTMMRDYRRRFP